MWDITLRELFWTVKMILRGWARRIWPDQWTGTPGVQVQNLDDTLRFVVHPLLPVKQWDFLKKSAPAVEDVLEGVDREV